MAILNDIS
ncbi:hypothetical protein Tco_1512072, partial [Tanacetum coccineum]